MVKKEIVLERPERFAGTYEVPKEKLEKAIEKALDKLERNIPRWMDQFVKTESSDFKYVPGANNNWVCGMHTGTYWLAYELSGNSKFREVAEKHMATYKERFERKILVDDHDVGFVFVPSCVAGYKVTGDEELRRFALEVAEYFYNTSYTKEGGFILRGCRGKMRLQDALLNPKMQEKHRISGCPTLEDYMLTGCRTMMDTLMNAPFLFWAGQESGKEEYAEAALSQSKISEKYLIREDASSFHHFQFQLETYEPIRGLTFQGYSDDSCWSRGHAWGVYGFPIAYSYVKEEFIIQLHKNITYYMLNWSLLMAKNLVTVQQALLLFAV